MRQFLLRIVDLLDRREALKEAEKVIERLGDALLLAKGYTCRHVRDRETSHRYGGYCDGCPLNENPFRGVCKRSKEYSK